MTARPVMTALAALILLTAVLASCGTLPVIRPLDAAGTQAAAERCRRPFLEAPHRFVHAVEAGSAERTVGTLLGVTLIDPPSGIARSAILTLEGFVLFDARYDGGVEVRRAVPPFDDPLFAENMMNDIRFIFLAPRGRLIQAGAMENGAACRYEDPRGQAVDVMVRPDDDWEITAWGRHNEPLRRAAASFVKDGIPEAVTLTGFHTVNYRLRMTLIRAERVTSGDVRN